MRTKFSNIISLQDKVDEIFKPGGILEQKGFEYRKTQHELALKITKVLIEKKHLAAEAGTGIGKSLAYLVPFILYCLEHDCKAIICTHTINLQEQLYHKDLPFIKELFKELFDEDFEYAFFMGRQNYVCGSRLKYAIENADTLFKKAVKYNIHQIKLFLHTSGKEGSKSEILANNIEILPEVWEEICSDRNVCSTNICTAPGACFYQKARERAANADVLILNHTLAMILLRIGDKRIIPDDSILLFDEAHTLEMIASQQLGYSISEYGLRRAILRLYNPKERKGLLAKSENKNLLKFVEETLSKSESFFIKLKNQFNFQNKNEIRIKKKKFIDYGEIYSALYYLAEQVKREAKGLPGFENTVLEDAAELLIVYADKIENYFNQKDENYVYWVEKKLNSGRLELKAVPLDVSTILQKLLFDRNLSCVFTSATLTTNGSGFNYFLQRIGANLERTDTIQLGSPFDYDKQMEVYIDLTVPNPPREINGSEDYYKCLAEAILKYLILTEARALVLFTSYKALEKVKDLLQYEIQQKGWTLLYQTRDESTSRHELVKKFREGKGCILFGTESFWTGIDIPGEALSNVIITRLPFTPPDHPILEAKKEIYKEKFFEEFSLPEALIKFRQGVGRLIRKADDKGIVVILDKRINNEIYGKKFRDVLPSKNIKTFQRKRLTRALAELPKSPALF